MCNPEVLITAVTSALNPAFQFPKPTEAGLPNIIMACFMSTQAGLSMVKDFVPPTPTSILKIKMPTIDLFIKPFMDVAILPPSYAAFSLGPVTIPGLGDGAAAFDVTGLFKLIVTLIMLPFTLITTFIKKLLKLEIALPTPVMVQDILGQIAIDVGLPAKIIAQLGMGLGVAICKLFKCMLGFGE